MITLQQLELRVDALKFFMVEQQKQIDCLIKIVDKLTEAAELAGKRLEEEERDDWWKDK